LFKFFLHNSITFWNANHKHDGEVTTKATHRCLFQVSLHVKKSLTDFSNDSRTVFTYQCKHQPVFNFITSL
jgi:hypothetical protein